MSQLDILSVDAKIKQAFTEDANKLPYYKEKLLDLQRTLQKEKLSTRAFRNLTNNIYELEEKIGNLKSGHQLNFYIAESSHTIERYKQILQTPVKLSFIGKASRDNQEKKDITLTYIKIAQKYTDMTGDIKISPKKSIIVVCNNCPNKNLFDIIDNSIYICLAEDVLSYVNSIDISEETTLKIYYPFLYNKNINSLEDLERNKDKLIQGNKKFDNEKTINSFNTINMFYCNYTH